MRHTKKKKKVTYPDICLEGMSKLRAQDLKKAEEKESGMK